MASSNIAELANSVASNTAKYSNYLAEHGLPLPSHDPTVNPAPTELPHEIAAARDAAIHASYELHELLIGPDGILLNGFYQVRGRALNADFRVPLMLLRVVAFSVSTSFIRTRSASL
jgi:hypothetical protein